MNTSLAMLVYNRPVHTALSLAYALAHKDVNTDINVFYSIHRFTTAASRATEHMLQLLRIGGHIRLRYLHADKAKSCGGNVDTLVTTMASDATYDCFIKMDDDILIGPGVDVLMSRLLLDLEPHGVMLLMGQMVPEHVNPEEQFSWDYNYEGYRVVQQARDRDPMETFAAVNPKMLQRINEFGESPLCGSPTGNFSRYTRTVIKSGHRSAVVLSPAVQLQHIGLTSSIRGGIKRSWAPATSWESPGEAIEIPHFDFSEWEQCDSLGCQREFALFTLGKLRMHAEEHQVPGLNLLFRALELYDPDRDYIAKPAPAQRAKDVSLVTSVRDTAAAVRHGPVITGPVVMMAQEDIERAAQEIDNNGRRSKAGMILRKLPDGRVVRSPQQVRRTAIVIGDGAGTTQ